jgi:hypothetical protein
MINKQDRKKSLKENSLTKQQGESIILRFIAKRRKRDFENRANLQRSTLKFGQNHKKLLGFKEEQKIYILR